MIPSHRNPKAATLIAAAALIGVLGISAVAAYRTLAQQFRADLVTDGEDSLNLYSEMTRGWLNRYRALSPIYARNPRVIDALRDPSDSDALTLLNSDLEIWNAASGASATYVMDVNGTTIAASNWSEPVSFVGNDFSFRPYFQEATEGRLGRFFGLGTTSGLRGYFFAAPVRDKGRLIGVVTTKIPVDGLEQDLRLSPSQVFISDASGIIILSGNPVFRLTSLAPVSPDDIAEIQEARQFDLTKILPAPISDEGSWLDGTYPVERAPSDRTAAKTAEFVHLTKPMLAEGWTLHLLADVAQVRYRLGFSALLLSAVAVAIWASSALMWQRRRRLLERLQDRERMQIVLEQRVSERTIDLSSANLKLQAEIGERRAVEVSLRQSQSELVQAGKLAALGQMSAALTHEFNQPLTAIRTYAENAMAFIDSKSPSKATENLGRVLRLTERMAQLSKHLTRFARRSQDTVEAVSLDAALSEALALLQGRIEKANASVSVLGDPDVTVLGGQVRLQHVLMNLVGNALDAVPDGVAPIVSIAVIRVDGLARIVVEDNGSGIPPEVLSKIFDPFFTTKDVGKGLGLGLSISFNIVKDFGGTLHAENRPEGGARFTVILQLGDDVKCEAAE